MSNVRRRTERKQTWKEEKKTNFIFNDVDVFNENDINVILKLEFVSTDIQTQNKKNSQRKRVPYSRRFFCANPRRATQIDNNVFKKKIKKNRNKWIRILDAVYWVDCGWQL